MADDPTTPDPTTDPDPQPDPKPEELGDAGKKALDSERAARRDAERAARAAQEKADEVQRQLDELRAGQMTEQEKALADARKEAADAARAEVEKQYRTRLDAADVAAAAANFRNPATAIKFLDLDALPRDAQGVLEPDALKAALARVLEAEPYLATEPASHGSADGGARGGSGPAQLTREDLQTMSPEQIMEAKAAGQLASLLGH